MDDLTAEALEAAIRHHKMNLAAKTFDGVEIGSEDCPLCALFVDDKCEGCPVKEKTGKALCDGSPFPELSHAAMDWACHGNSKENRKTFRAAEKAEIAFLKSLREGVEK